MRGRWRVLLEDGDGETSVLELVTDDRDGRVAERAVSMTKAPNLYGTRMLWAAATRTGAFKGPFEEWEHRQISGRMVQEIDDGLGGPADGLPDPTVPASGDT